MHSVRYAFIFYAFLKKLFPVLDTSSTKGDFGRIAIIGGSKEYSGAPYFAAMSAMKAGGDLSYVFCHPDALIPIKSYSPELIVHGSLQWDYIEQHLWRFHSIVIGPGLGRGDENIGLMKNILHKAKENKDLRLVIDADGIFLLEKLINEVKGCTNVCLTPNRREFKKLYESVLKEKLDESKDPIIGVTKLSQELENVSILCKGKEDSISIGSESVICDVSGSPRRCGGQGDLLSGILALFLFWSKRRGDSPHDILDAAACSSLFIRHLSARTFKNVGRSMLALNMLEEIEKLVFDIDKM
uniref:ATP-dependent (S)-NAD(P)H-hydrate dehydratase n=1 Tax=Acrobeloides nanus TaxID=290746 RepID=A0A914DAV2_9BILA